MHLRGVLVFPGVAVGGQHGHLLVRCGSTPVRLAGFRVTLRGSQMSGHSVLPGLLCPQLRIRDVLRCRRYAAGQLGAPLLKLVDP
jgi:hypothetical protein